MKDCPQLQLENQICFPIYTASRLITQKYQPFLQQLNITYPQYLVLLVLWEQDNISISQLGEKLFLQTNTLTPLIKRMVDKGLITKKRTLEDERVVKVSLTEKAKKMKSKAKDIPLSLAKSVELSQQELSTMYQLMWKLIQLNQS